MSSLLGVSAAQLVPASADALVADFNAASRRLWRRRVSAVYELEDEHATWFNTMVEAFGGVTRASALWRVNASGLVSDTFQYKRNSGAREIVRRDRAKAHLAGPRVLRTNISVPSIECGRHALYFLPDRLLVRDRRRLTDLAYSTVHAQAGSTRFHETDRRPRDAQQVATTWQFVNVKGGPDRRYKNNRQIPVMLYGEAALTSATGLRWMLECSVVQPLERLVQLVGQAPKTVASQSSPTDATQPDTPPPPPLPSSDVEPHDEGPREMPVGRPQRRHRWRRVAIALAIVIAVFVATGLIVGPQKNPTTTASNEHGTVSLTVARAARVRHLVAVSRSGEARWIVRHGGHLFVWHVSHARFSEAAAHHVPRHGALYADKNWATRYRQHLKQHKSPHARR